MRRHKQSALILVCLVGTVTILAADRPKSSDLQNVMFNQEHALAKAEQQQDRGFFTRALDDSMIYVAYNGLVFTKQKIVGDLSYIDVSNYGITNLKVRALGPRAALVTYDLDIKGNIAGRNLPAKQYASSIWVHGAQGWKLMFHQATPADHH